MRYSVRFEEGYDLYDERYESWLKTNRPDVVSKTCTASSPNNTQISEAQQAPISSTSPLMSQALNQYPKVHPYSLLQNLYKHLCLLMEYHVLLP